MRQLHVGLVALALALGAGGVAFANEGDGVIDPWQPDPPAAAQHWSDPPVVDVVTPWKDDRPQLVVKAPLVDPWKSEPHVATPPRGAIVNPWAAEPTARFPDIASADDNPDGIVNPWPHAAVPTARFDDVTIVDPWARRH